MFFHLSYSTYGYMCGRSSLFTIINQSFRGLEVLYFERSGLTTGVHRERISEETSMGNDLV